MKKPMELEAKLKQAKARTDFERRKSAAANRENEALRAEIRKLRNANFTLQHYVDSPASQMGYKRRYEELLEAVTHVKDLLNVVGNGLVKEPPVTMEPPTVPTWSRVDFRATQ